MTNAYRNYSAGIKETPQSEPIPGRTDMVKNSAGGYTFQVSNWDMLDRFLILGTQGGTFYIKEKELTAKNADSVIACIKEDGTRTVNRIAAVSHEGRALSNDPAIFALALCFVHGDAATKAAAKAALPQICRIGTHLFHFAQYVDNMRGWGRGLKTAVADWYNNRSADSLAYQVIKYQQRDGWSHADLIKLSHPKGHLDIGNYVLGERFDTNGRKHEPVIREVTVPSYKIIEGFEMIKKVDTAKEAAAIINTFRLPREAVPTQHLNTKEVWEALLETDMPLEAMIRNLGNMGKVGLLEPMSAASKLVVERLEDEEALRKARIHPLRVLIAQRTYAGGKGLRGHNEWTVVPQVKDALEGAFYATFKHVEPSGKNTLLALDVSGSMSSQMMGLPITFCEGTAVMAMVTARAEKNYIVRGFSNTFKDLKITAADTLESATKKAQDNNFGSTDCSLPMVEALKNKWPIEAFCVYTDNETWAGRSQPVQALAQFRKEMNIPAKLAVIGMAANPFTIADPKDPGMMDFVGFDTNTPAAIAAFMAQ